eukprot:Gregarina_sp_Poly_1__8134@NODE_46_length_17826_cov_295_961822_g40_i0_p3_GENE_NODE_46_length_17826_cov_295_961822_g40_i0NODE_46_length_17826_cov_295_961822_g40_i0_p3_ORF_typecomplete_len551_score62_60DUF5585/PF17823_1/0_012DUF4366/PF14283_6/0_55KAR9/PF08580_10/3_7AJAP1_PANP_C/PF15298_6/6_7Podoplanin/PF05808_11/11_NODE_46_length_17826_cov_295_961822_g40_i033765028
MRIFLTWVVHCWGLLEATVAGLNLETDGLKAFLWEKYWVDSMDNLEYDENESLDIMLLVDLAHWELADPDEGPRNASLVLLSDYLIQNYPQHRVAVAHYNNKPLPGKGYGKWPGVYWSRTEFEYGDADCYGSELDFQDLSDPDSADTFHVTTANVWFRGSPFPTLSNHSDLFTGLFSSLTDEIFEWRPDVRKLMLVAPLWPVELGNNLTFNAQTLIDYVDVPNYPDHCGTLLGYGSWGLGHRAYGNEAGYYSAYRHATKARCEGRDPEGFDGENGDEWEKITVFPWSKTLQPFDLDVLRENRSLHCVDHEFLGSDELLKLWKPYQDDHAVSFVFLEDAACGDNPIPGEVTCFAEPFGSQFLPDHDQHLAQFPVLIQSGRNDKIGSMIDNAIKLATGKRTVTTTTEPPTTTTPEPPSTTTTTTPEPPSTTTTEPPSTTTGETTSSTTASQHTAVTPEQITTEPMVVVPEQSSRVTIVISASSTFMILLGLGSWAYFGLVRPNSPQDNGTLPPSADMAEFETAFVAVTPGPEEGILHFQSAHIEGTNAIGTK